MADHPVRLNTKEETKINLALKNNKQLDIVYSLKNKLHEILHTREIKHESFVETLNKWCDEAKSHGIESIDQFLERLKCYKVIWSYFLCR